MGMMGWGWTPWNGVLSLLLLILLILLVGAAILLFRAAVRSKSHPSADPGRATPLEVLQERYARGEIDREEYLQKKSDVGG